MKMDKSQAKDIDTDALVQSVASISSVQKFKEEYCTPETVTEREIEGLGISISQWAEWDCLKIMKVFSAALEDSNFHSFNEIVTAKIEEMEAKNK